MSVKSITVAAPRVLAMGLLGPLERRRLERVGEARPAPVFIVGPPRSGTTLLYELLATRFRVAYISNLAHRLFRTPCAATALGRRVIERHRGRYRSRHGHVAGWGAPSEGGWIWTRWLPRDEAASLDHLAMAERDEIRRTIAALQGALSGPFIAKSVAHSVQIPALRSVFPRATFIEMRRNPIENIKSILRYRRDVAPPHGAEQWRSVRPPGWMSYRNADLVTQACAQLRLTQRAIHDGLALDGTQRRLTVSYEDLCGNPEHELRRVATYLEAQGLIVRDRRRVPDRFEPGMGANRDDSMPMEIIRRLALVDASLAADHRREIRSWERRAA